jgi:hypothetical protein
MAKTVEEILRESGLTDEQIKALDAKVVSGLTQVVSTATQTLEAAELAKRAQAEQYDTNIAPALDAWANEKAQKDAEIAFYKAQLDGAKAGGFITTTLPGTLPTPAAGTPAAVRGPDGKFVAGGNPVPGSPSFDPNKLRDDIGAAFSFSADTQWKYRTLFGKEMPDSPTTLIREATAQHMSPSAWAAKKYDFAGKEKAISEQQQKDHDDAIRKEVAAAKDKEWGEKVGSNPDVRRAEVSRFSEINKAVKAGTRPDPLAPGLSEAQRDAGTRSAIRAEVATQTVQ